MDSPDIHRTARWMDSRAHLDVTEKVKYFLCQDSNRHYTNTSMPVLPYTPNLERKTLTCNGGNQAVFIKTWCPCGRMTAGTFHL